MYEVKEFNLFTKWGNALKTFQREGTNDAGALISNLIQDEYHLSKYNFPRNSVAIDLGSHIGAVTLALLSAGFGKVIAVEVLRDNYNLMINNLAANSFLSRTVTLHNAAWGNTPQNVVMTHTGTQTTTGQIHKFIGSAFSRKDMSSVCEDGETEVARSLSINQIFEDQKVNYCHFLKVDIEGSEWEALKDIKYLDRIGIISGEVHRIKGIDIVRHGDLLSLLDNKFEDYSVVYEPQYSIPGDVSHFVYVSKNLPWRIDG
jgi:FkbM family methyltransferase